jgi:hypothetical protein
MRRTFKTIPVREGSGCFLRVPFDPKPVFGRVRAPVRVTIDGYTYRSTIASMGDGPCIPLRRSHREAAGLVDGKPVDVTLDLDEEKRVVTLPADLRKALRASPSAWDRWREISYSHQREHLEAIAEAKKPETRTRRIARAVEMLEALPPRKRRPRARRGQSAGGAEGDAGGRP